MEVTVIHILLSLIVDLIQNLSLELTEFLHILLVSILVTLAIGLYEVIHPIKGSKIKLAQPGQFRSD